MDPLLGQESVKAVSQPKLTMAQRVALVATDFHRQCTGHAPRAVTVALNDFALVVTLHDALSPAEKAVARTAKGAANIIEFHRRLFLSSVDVLCDQIRRVTGVAVREAAVEVETATGAVVHIFTTGTMVQVFQLAGNISAEAWNSCDASDDAGTA